MEFAAGKLDFSRRNLKHGASGTNFLPFSKVTLVATVRNSGDVAITNVSISFWDGHPTNGGILIATKNISGWLPGAGTNLVTTPWTVSEALTHTLYATIDPDRSKFPGGRAYSLWIRQAPTTSPGSTASGRACLFGS